MGYYSGLGIFTGAVLAFKNIAASAKKKVLRDYNISEEQWLEIVERLKGNEVYNMESAMSAFNSDFMSDSANGSTPLTFESMVLACTELLLNSEQISKMEKPRFPDNIRFSLFDVAESKK